MQSTSRNQGADVLGVQEDASPAILVAGTQPADAPEPGPNGTAKANISSFVSTKTHDPEALGLLVEASEYAAAAMRRMAKNTAGDRLALQDLTDQYIDIVFGLEVNFLFPNLPADKRELLVAIMKVRNSISALLNGAPRAYTSADKAAIERLSTQLNLEFLELRTKVLDSGIEEQLDPVQRKVFEDEFFSITLDKTCNTRLFFRKDTASRPASRAAQEQQLEAARRADSCASPTVSPTPSTAWAPVETPERPTELGTHAQASQLETPLIDQEGAPQPPEPVDPRRKTVLLISADPAATERVRHSLRPVGYEVLVANTGFAGYSTAMRERPDLILVDLSLSVAGSGLDACLDGHGVVRMLSKLPPKRALAFILLGPNGDDDDKSLARSTGAKACLQRPVDPNQVLSAVRVALDEVPAEMAEETQTRWMASATA